MRRILVGAALLCVMATGACGDGSASQSPDEAQSRCAEPTEDDPTDYSGAAGRAVDARQAELRGDMGRLQKYGLDHPDEYTSVAFDNYPSVKVVGYFTDNIDTHKAAAARVMEHPEVLEIRQSVQTDRDAQRIMEALRSDDRSLRPGISYGPRSNGVVYASLGTTKQAQAYAQELLDTHGNGICIDLAGHPFPKGSAPDKSTCPDPLATDRVAGVSVDVTVASPVRRGEAGTGTVRITNNTPEPVKSEGGTTTRAVVLLPGTNEVIARFTGFSDLGGRTITVQPGTTAEVPITFVTDDCRADSDYSLPPGDYVVSTNLDGFGRSNDAAVTVVE